MIIGLTGRKGSGKSTFGKLLNEEFFKTEFKDTPEISFAAPLRQLLLTLVGEDPSVDGLAFKLTEGPKTKELPIVQVLGCKVDDILTTTVEANKFIEDLYGKPLTPVQTIELIEILFDYGSIRKTLTIRQALQYIGTEWARKHWPTLWLDLATDNIITALKTNTNVIITDCRFPNEAERIRAMGGKVVLVDRPSLVGLDTHSSEVPLPEDMVDITVENDGTVEDLKLVADFLASDFELQNIINYSKTIEG